MSARSIAAILDDCEERIESVTDGRADLASFYSYAVGILAAALADAPDSVRLVSAIALDHAASNTIARTRK